jgi:hypothetical protein
MEKIVVKTLENDLFKKLFAIIILLLFSFLIVSFFLILEFREGYIEIYTLFSMLTLYFFALVFLLFKVLTKIRKNILEDVDSLSEYLHNISENKQYDSKLYIKNYLEFLHISIVLKNIVKRLRAKSKKR